MLKIEQFFQGRDEEDWVRVWNAAYTEYEEARQITVDEFKSSEKAPRFDPEGRFIAKLDNQPVGIIHAHVDKERSEKKGFVRSFGVIPNFRGKGIEEKLAEKAMKELRSRGMIIVQAWATDRREDRISLWKSLGFNQIRVFSLMKRDLDEIPSGIGENLNVALRPLRKESDEDVNLLNWLDNECFKEHFNYRPSTVEETAYLVRKDPFIKFQKWFFAILNEEHVGYVGVGVDEKYNAEKNVKSGWVMDIGVLKPFRRRGIGTRLMLQGMETLKTIDMTSIMLGVDDWNVTKAIKLYEKVGFKVKKKDLTFEKNIE